MTHLLMALRAANVALATLALFGLMIRLNYTWSGLSIGLRALRAGILLLFASIAIGSAVRYLRHVPVDFTIPLVTTACVLVLVGLWASRTDDLPPGR